MIKSKLWLTLGAAIAVSMLAAGSTLALFTASSGTIDSQFTAGTLCLTANRNDGEPVPGPMFYVTPQQGRTPGGIDGTLPTGVWALGDSHIRTLTVENPTSCSTMDAWLERVDATLQSGDATLAQKLWVEVYTPQSGGPDVLVAQGYLSDFLAGPQTLAYPTGSRIPVYLTSNRHLKFKVSFDLNADNTYQNKDLVVTFTVYGTQMNNNP